MGKDQFMDDRADPTADMPVEQKALINAQTRAGPFTQQLIASLQKTPHLRDEDRFAVSASVAATAIGDIAATMFANRPADEVMAIRHMLVAAIFVIRYAQGAPDAWQRATADADLLSVD